MNSMSTKDREPVKVTFNGKDVSYVVVQWIGLTDENLCKGHHMPSTSEGYTKELYALPGEVFTCNNYIKQATDHKTTNTNAQILQGRKEEEQVTKMTTLKKIRGLTVLSFVSKCLCGKEIPYGKRCCVGHGTWIPNLSRTTCTKCGRQTTIKKK
jgi:hypothetical protein